MYIEFIQEHVGQMGQPIKIGTRCHKLNEAAKLLISQGIAKPVEDPENYEPHPISEAETSSESSTGENDQDIKPNKPRKRPRKAPPKRR
jgi:hypothetical protein